MTYRTILVEVVTEAGAEDRLRVADGLARRFGAALIGMHVVPSPLESAVAQGLAAVCLGRETIEAVRRAELAARERARAVFRHVCGADPAPVWREAEGDPARLVAAAARMADLVIAGRTQRRRLLTDGP
jgi:hypothetical protein